MDQKQRITTIIQHLCGEIGQGDDFKIRILDGVVELLTAFGDERIIKAVSQRALDKIDSTGD